MKNNKWNIPAYETVKKYLANVKKSIVRIFLIEHKKLIYCYGYMTLLQEEKKKQKSCNLSPERFAFLISNSSQIIIAPVYYQKNQITWGKGYQTL